MAKEPTKITLEERAIAIVGDLLTLMRDIDAAKSKRGAKDDGPEAPEGSEEREAPARGRGRGAKAEKPAKADKAEQAEKDPADMTVLHIESQQSMNESGPLANAPTPLTSAPLGRIVEKS